MKNILVTGGCGYVGVQLVPRLLNNNYKVIVIDTCWFGNKLKKNKNLTIIKKDIRSIEEKYFNNIDTVIHLASISNDPSSELNPKLAWEVGPLATYKILQICVKKKIKNFFYASSGSVYGVSKKLKVTEKTNLLPISDYNKQKMVTEKILETYSSKIRTVAIRPATVCGFSNRLRLDVTVNILTYQAYKNKIITVFGGKQIRPNIHISDMVDIYLFLLKNKKVKGIFNAGFENLSVLNIAQKIQKLTSCKIKILKSNDPRSYRLDSSKLLKTGFKPKRNVDFAISELLNFFNKKKFKSNDNNVNLKVIKKLYE
ncbi:SDR family oxidoreductase [Candidatus Pelagibacter communis]|uniref:UDP-glucose 4 epimerase n=1 Tax=Pelagibacter ubique (strain HTCC1062) TaxID=335992 RepID=Q4FN80_PELUB|nr:SDR family oxidoreductase [Candidatus Pelagibacter ubique]AAZ21359.1 UDP-glucose 4 epimerase [Candidatus Pelagibacter ubique HTCC1062]|tara:strand:- start:1487 stop:2425 length:939 start_codon:yes stop_codon:yes gene_type:complete